MSLEAGTRLGPYEIRSPIGAGGMGFGPNAEHTRFVVVGAPHADKQTIRVLTNWESRIVR